MRRISLGLLIIILISMLSLSLTSCDLSVFFEEETGFVITFDNQGHGEQPEEIIDTFKIPASLPALSEDGYIFGGWYYDKECTTIVVASMMILSDVTLYAKWTVEPEPETYYVSFNINGHGNSVKQVNDVTSIPELPILKEDGYTFGGWYYDINCTKPATTGDEISKNTTLYAKWSVNAYKVKFNSLGGSNVNEISVEYNKTITKPNNPTKDGYTFDGWYKDEELTIAWNFNTDKVNSDITLYAKWIKNTFEVKFNTNDGSVVENQIVLFNGLITKPSTPTKERYTFEGWYKDEELTVAWNFETDKVTEDMTLYAKWIKSTFEVEFDTIEGSKIENQLINLNGLITKPLNPTKEGYIFEGWYKDVTLLEEWNFETDIVTTDIILYAKWTPDIVVDENKFIIQFNTMGHGVTPDYVSNVTSIPTELPQLTEDGYTFGGWYYDSNCQIPVSIGETIYKNTTIYAKWTQITYYIVFNVQGHGNAPTTISGIIEVPENLPQLSKDGYIFGGWYYDETCTNLVESGDSLSTNITIYAKWTQITYSITFDVQGHGIVPEKIEGIVEVPTSLPIVSLDDYEFGGWYYDEACTNLVESGDSLSTNITIYAKWTEIVIDNTSTFQVHFLELGNKYTGDCIYIKAGDSDILIDAGSRKSSSTAIIDYVDQYCTDGVLEYVIVTHAHQDHIAAFVDNSSSEPGIFSYYDVEVIIDFAKYNTTSQISKDYFTARDKEVAAGAKHYTALDCIRGTNGGQRVFTISDDISFEILEQKYYYTNTSNENDYSVCTLFKHNDEYFLFTGDLELSGEQSLVALNNLPKIKVFKGGHHGSGTSSNECLLSVIQPEIVCICTCAGSDEYTKNLDNMFPYQEVIDRLAKYTNKIYVTSVATYTVGINGSTEYLKTTGFKSLNGNIVVTSNSDGVTVNCSNNNTILKDSEWFNTKVTLNGVTRTIRTWPSYGK